MLVKSHSVSVWVNAIHYAKHHNCIVEGTFQNNAIKVRSQGGVKATRHRFHGLFIRHANAQRDHRGVLSVILLPVNDVQSRVQ